MPIEIDSSEDDMNDVARKLKGEYDQVEAVAVIVTGNGFVGGGFDREGWLFSDLMGAIECCKHQWISQLYEREKSGMLSNFIDNFQNEN